MSEPFVCCITPTHMPEYWDRVKACFDAQTYPHKAHFIMDTRGMRMTVGALRNAMLRDSVMSAGALIAHLDHDDWSAPTRLAEQVEFMQRMNAPVVGYSDMPFYDVERDRVLFYDSRNPHYALGTSLMYRREVWERVPFPDQTPEDTTWQNMVGPSNVRSMSSIGPFQPEIKRIEDLPSIWEYGKPRMVQTIHKGNASPKVGARFQPAGAEMECAVRDILSRYAVHA